MHKHVVGLNRLIRAPAGSRIDRISIKFSFMNANCKTSSYFPFKIRWLVNSQEDVLDCSDSVLFLFFIWLIIQLELHKQFMVSSQNTRTRTCSFPFKIRWLVNSQEDLTYLSFIVRLFWCSNVWTNDLRNNLLVINLSKHIELAYACYLLLKCLFQAKKYSGHVYVS
jgi:hypothetical protein